MTVVELLKAARKLLIAGWAGPEDFLGRCQRIVGTDPHSGDPVYELVYWDAEVVDRFTVGGAFCASSSRDQNRNELVLAAWSEFERIVSPVWWEEEQHGLSYGFKLPPLTDATRSIWNRSLEFMRTPHGPSAREWLEDPNRSLSDVLRAFDKAINKAKKGERR